MSSPDSQPSSRVVLFTLGGCGAFVLVVAACAGALWIVANREPPPPPADFASNPIEAGDAIVRLDHASTSTVWVIRHGERRISGDAFFQVRVEIENRHPTRPLEYSGWHGGGDRAQLRDEFGNSYSRATWDGQVWGQIESKRINPGEKVEDLLVFQRPVGKATKLILTLPLANVGGSGAAQVVVPNGYNRKS